MARNFDLSKRSSSPDLHTRQLRPSVWDQRSQDADWKSSRIETGGNSRGATAPVLLRVKKKKGDGANHLLLHHHHVLGKASGHSLCHVRLAHRISGIWEFRVDSLRCTSGLHSADRLRTRAVLPQSCCGSSSLSVCAVAPTDRLVGTTRYQSRETLPFLVTRKSRILLGSICTRCSRSSSHNPRL